MKILLLLLAVPLFAQAPVPVAPPGTTAAVQPVQVSISEVDALRVMNADLQRRLIVVSVCASLGLSQDCVIRPDQGFAVGRAAVVASTERPPQPPRAPSPQPARKTGSK